MMTNPQFLHLTQPDILDFDASVIEQVTLADGRQGVILDRTYFYAEGGGQEPDRGKLGEANVLDVYKDGQPPRVVHIVDRPLPLGPVQGHIDREHRLGSRQAHTAQHLLSQCFLTLFDIPSLSAHMHAEAPSTLDIAGLPPSRATFDQVEDLANQVIYENRPVRAYFVTPEQLKALPLRWPPSVNENIRIIEIDGFDYTPCGGTHCSSTGQIGQIRILRGERQGEQTRLWFTAGRLALVNARQQQEILAALAALLGVGYADLPGAVSRQSEQLKDTGLELTRLRQEGLAAEASSLSARAEAAGFVRMLVMDFGMRPLDELRQLANLLKDMPGLAAALACHDGSKYSVVVSCAVDTHLSARDWLAGPLAEAGGRGGGSPRLAQGGGPLTSEQPARLLESLRNKLSL